MRSPTEGRARPVTPPEPPSPQAPRARPRPPGVAAEQEPEEEGTTAATAPTPSAAAADGPVQHLRSALLARVASHPVARRPPPRHGRRPPSAVPQAVVPGARSVHARAQGPGPARPDARLGQGHGPRVVPLAGGPDPVAWSPSLFRPFARSPRPRPDSRPERRPRATR